MEQWVPIKGYEGEYEVSDAGNVRSLKYRNRPETRKLSKLNCGKGFAEGNGYLMVILCKNGVQKKHKVHRLVAEAFIHNPEGKPMVNHINGNKKDNRVENLEWCTESENQKHAYANGLKVGSAEWGKVLGFRHGAKGRAKRRAQQMRAIIATNITTGETAEYESAAAAERATEVCHSSIAKVCRGKQRAAKGFTFRYKDNGRD